MKNRGVLRLLWLSKLHEMRNLSFILLLNVFVFSHCRKEEKKEEVLFRKGWVINNDKMPVDSVAVYDFGDSLLTYTNSDGYFELKAKKKDIKT